MSDKDVLISNINKIHTTNLGNERIMNNLKIDDNVVELLKNKILDNDCIVYKKGKNYYCEIDNIIISINSHNYCIITSHILK